MNLKLERVSKIRALPCSFNAHIAAVLSRFPPPVCVSSRCSSLRCISFTFLRRADLRTLCDECHADIAVARLDSHDCEQEAQTKALISKMTKQAVKKNDDSAKMAKQVAKKSDDSTKGTKRKTEPKAVIKKTKKAKGKDPNAPKRPASGFFIFMETFRKEYKDANPDAKGVAVVGKAGGEKWKQMSEEEKAVYNKEAETRKATYEQAMIKYKNKDSAKDDGEVSEDAAEDEEEEANVEDE